MFNKKLVGFDHFDVGPRRIAYIESRIDSLESKTSEGWTNSFQTTEIGKLTSRISDLMGRVSELEKQAIEPQMPIEEPTNVKSTKPSIAIDHDRLNCTVEMDSIVVETLVNIQQASRNLLDHFQQTGIISLSLLKELCDSLDYDNNPSRIVSIDP